MTKINIGPLDRVTHGSAELRLVSKSDAGYVLARVGAIPELHETFTHAQIKQLIETSEIAVHRNWFEEGRAKARLTAGVSSLSELPREEANNLMRREYYVVEFLKREAMDKNVKRTDKSIVRTLRQIHAERPVRDVRCDQVRAERACPSARTFRRWLSAYADGGFDVLALRTKYRNSGNPFSNLDPLAYKVLNDHAALYCDETRPTVNGIFLKMKAAVASLNEERTAQGRAPLNCPAKSTLVSRIKSFNQFEVYASRHGIAKARAKFAIVGAGLDVVRPLQHVQIDEWSIQLHTIVNDLGLGGVLTDQERLALKNERLKICAAIDVATRCVLGFRISNRSDAANAIAVLAMTERTRRRLRNPPDACPTGRWQALSG